MKELFDTIIKQFALHESRPEVDKIIDRFNNKFGTNLNPDGDKTAWCSIYLNMKAFDLGYEHSGSALARSWLRVGDIVTENWRDLSNTEIGDVVVLWRKQKRGTFGHVGLLVTYTDKYVYLLGANQNNEVNISRYARNRILSVNRLNKI